MVGGSTLFIQATTEGKDALSAFECLGFLQGMLEPAPTSSQQPTVKLAGLWTLTSLTSVIVGSWNLATLRIFRATRPTYPGENFPVF